MQRHKFNRQISVKLQIFSECVFEPKNKKIEILLRVKMKGMKQARIKF